MTQSVGAIAVFVLALVVLAVHQLRARNRQPVVLGTAVVVVVACVAAAIALADRIAQECNLGERKTFYSVREWKKASHT